MIKLRFDLEPVAQARPRATRMAKGIRLYDPKPTAMFKKYLHVVAKRQYQGEPLSGEIHVKVDYYRPVQKSLSKAERTRRLNGTVRPVVKPDLDNYMKSSFDALNGILWADDAMIVEIHSNKWYSDEPRIEIEVWNDEL